MDLAGVRDRLAEAGVGCRLGAFADDETQPDALPALVRDFVAGVPAGQVVYDLTTGTGWMRWLVDHRAMPAGSWRVYLRHRSKNPDSRPEVGTEDPIPWRVGAKSDAR